MITPSVRLVDWLEPHDLESYEPPTESWMYPIAVYIGYSDGPGQDIYHFSICSLKWLEERLDTHAVVFGHKLLVFSRFSYEDLMRALERICENAVAETGEQVTRALGKYGGWEFAPGLPVFDLERLD